MLRTNEIFQYRGLLAATIHTSGEVFEGDIVVDSDNILLGHAIVRQGVGDRRNSSERFAVFFVIFAKASTAHFLSKELVMRSPGGRRKTGG